jgi:hypothetical protein
MRVLVAAGVILTLLRAAPADAQIVVKANDDRQSQARRARPVLGRHHSRHRDRRRHHDNLFVRRFRVMFGGQVAKNVTFFAETDVPNLGKTVNGVKTSQPTLILQDAYGELKASEGFMLDAGYMYIPFSTQRPAGRADAAAD